MQIEMKPIDQIKTYWRNARDNTKAVEAVKESIIRYGFNQPIVIDTENVIIAGHTRYKALLELGNTEIPCVVADLPPEKAKAYRIADNKTSEFASWDLEVLIPELRTIQSFEDMQDFFPTIDLDQLLREASINEPPTQTQIDNRKEELESRFTETSNAAKESYVEVVCPECAEVFMVRSDDLKASHNQR
jgi:site-specific DNA-methyltransferase (adenine-specific)